MKSTTPENEILRVDRLSVTAAEGGERKEILRDVSFVVGAGETLSIVGASGSGKTTLACALTRLFASKQMTMGGSVHFLGRDLALVSDDELRAVLRSEIRYLFQEPGQSLNPIARLSTQMHFAFDQQPSSTRRCAELFSRFGLDDPDRLMHSFPHELSIGTLQRVLLAMALAPSPKLLIADEPTSAIDSLVKHQMMDALRLLSRDEGLAVIFITHDMHLANKYGDRVAVMAGGRIREDAPVKHAGAAARSVSA